MILPTAQTILELQQGIAAGKRSGKTGHKLLDDSDNNIGNSTTLQPQVLPLLPVGQQFVVAPNLDAPRLLNLTGDSKHGMSTSVVITAARPTNTPGSAGPITAVIEFGNGSQTTRFEVDVPFGPYTGQSQYSAASASPIDGGTIIQIPTGTLRVFVRYDNALVTPTIEGWAFGALNSPAPLPPASGPFAPNAGFNQPPGGAPSQAAPMVVKAFAGYFGRHFCKAYKTNYCYIGDRVNPVLFATPGSSSVAYCVPPFAKTLRVVRMPETASITVGLFDQIASGSNATNRMLFNESYVIPANTPSPVIPIDGQTNTVTIGSTTNADLVSGVKLVWEIGF